MKKTNKFIALILTLIMTMSFTVVGNADTDANIPIGAGGLDLNPETLSVGDTLSTATNTFTKTFTCSPQVDCNLNFVINKTSQDDKYKGNSTYEIYVSTNLEPQDVFKTEEALMDYPLDGGKTYYFKVKRTYTDELVKDVYLSVTAKVNPEVINQSFNGEYNGNEDISKYYSFTPSHDGGFLFKMTPSAGCTGKDKNYILTVNSKNGASVNETASYEEGKSESKLRLYLKEGVEYIIMAQGFGADGLGYKFSVDTVPIDTSVALVGATPLALSAETSCTLIPFANKRAYDWYSFTAPTNGCYEFEVNNGVDASSNGDVIAELHDESFAPVEDDEKLYLYEDEKAVVYKAMKQGEVCYIQLAEMYTGNFSDIHSVGITVREHTHLNKIIIDGDYVVKGCPCGLEDGIEYSFYLEKVRINNVTYTGKTAKPNVKFDIVEDLPGDDSVKIEIPSSAYTVTLTSSNKKNIGPAKAKVKFVGEYKRLGTFNVSFKIVPKGTSLSSVKVGKKSFTAKWKKQTTKTSGYELRYATNVNMTSAKTVTIKDNKKVSKKVSKLKSKKTYFVQVRTYKTVSGKKYCSSWSEKTLVTTK